MGFILKTNKTCRHKLAVSLQKGFILKSPIKVVFFCVDYWCIWYTQTSYVRYETFILEQCEKSKMVAEMDSIILFPNHARPHIHSLTYFGHIELPFSHYLRYVTALWFINSIWLPHWWMLWVSFIQNSP